MLSSINVDLIKNVAIGMNVFDSIISIETIFCTWYDDNISLSDNINHTIFAKDGNGKTINL